MKKSKLKKRIRELEAKVRYLEGMAMYKQTREENCESMWAPFMYQSPRQEGMLKL